MADNMNVTPGTGKTIAADDVSGVLYQRVKIVTGADGTATDLGDAAPLPVSDAGGSLTVDGAVTVSGTVTATGPLTDTQLRASAVPVSDGGSTISIDDGGGAITVDGTVGISGTVTATQATVSMTTVTSTTSTSGDNTIIAAPGASTRIVICSLQIQLEAATATTVLKKSGSTTIGRLYCAAAGDGAIFVYPAGRELRLGTNEAFVINLSGANATGYTVRYFTEAA